MNPQFNRETLYLSLCCTKCGQQFKIHRRSSPHGIVFCPQCNQPLPAHLLKKLASSDYSVGKYLPCPGALESRTKNVRTEELSNPKALPHNNLH